MHVSDACESLLGVLRARLDLVFPEGEGTGFASQPEVDTTCVAELSSRLASPPDGCVVGSTVAALGAYVVHIGVVGGVAVVGVSVDELLWAQSVSLLEVQTACIA